MDNVFYLGKEGVFIAVKINCELFIDKVKVRVFNARKLAHTFLDLFRTMRTIEFLKKQSHFTHFTFSYTTKIRSLTLLADMLDTHIEYDSDVFIGNGIIDCFSLTSILYKSSLLQHSELMRDSGL